MIYFSSVRLAPRTIPQRCCTFAILGAGCGGAAGRAGCRSPYWNRDRRQKYERRVASSFPENRDVLTYFCDFFHLEGDAVHWLVFGNHRD